MKCITAALILVAASGCGAKSVPKVDNVVYSVTGDLSEPGDTVDLTMATATGTSQTSGSILPVSNTGNFVSSGIHLRIPSGKRLYVSAQNNGSGAIRCTIQVNGVTISSNVATGQASIATCEGKAP